MATSGQKKKVRKTTIDISEFKPGFGLRKYQAEAVQKMRNGCILCGGYGSGKSRTAVAYYYIQNGGSIYTEKYLPMASPANLYIITTARKRDTFEWEPELATFLISVGEASWSPYKGLKVAIDSWNNIAKYQDVTDSFFIFDEQRVVGKGPWVDAFIKIARDNGNKWVLLSATPGDTWMDYIPVFIANRFYKNRTEFLREHVIRKPYVTWFEVDSYRNIGRLNRLRRRLLIDMDFMRSTKSHHEDIWCGYDISQYKQICRMRWDPWKDEPIENASGFCYALRKVVNSSDARQVALLEVLEKHPKVIIFYNFDYELEILLNLGKNFYPKLEIAQWNGHKHQEIPEGDRWIYLVQYTAGAEGWNCIKTDTVIFWSQNYSYKTMVQASGRIDRLNTPYHDLYYYHLKSKSGIDLAINKALKNKKQFNETRFVNERM